MCKIPANEQNLYQVRCSNSGSIGIGEFAVFHAKTNFAFAVFDWIVLASNDVLLRSIPKP